jgi:hypothetical protein
LAWTVPDAVTIGSASKISGQCDDGEQLVGQTVTDPDRLTKSKSSRRCGRDAILCGSNSPDFECGDESDAVGSVFVVAGLDPAIHVSSPGMTVQ